MAHRIGVGDFWAKASPGKTVWNGEPCLEWQLYRDKDGYGRTRHEGKTDRAHRVAYMIAVGPIPAKYEIDHLCRNRCCINPRHLEAVTKRINVIRGKAPTAINAAKTHCQNGHEFTPENTYPRPDGGRQCRTCNRNAVAAYKQRRISA